MQALGFQVLRWLGRAEALRRHLAKRAPPPAADALLCTALALGWDAANAPYEPFTLVDQAVEAAKRDPATRAQGSFINACLRRFLRERDDLVAATDHEPVAQWNHPRWWIERLKRDHPREWQRILTADNEQPPMTLRVNARKTTVADYLQALAAVDLDASPVAESGVQLARARPVQLLPGFAEGEFSVQDAAAQLAAPLLLEGLVATSPAPAARARCLRGPGRQDGAPARIPGRRAHRGHGARSGRGAQPSASTRRWRAWACMPACWWPTPSRTEQWWDGALYDAILLDAPCTASGIVRRHPDVRWLRRESDIEQLALQQAMLLAALWPLVRPGGRLLYCTCSVFRQEGSHQIEAFLAHNTDARLLPSPGHLLPQSGVNARGVPDNPLGEHDGFFYALLEKQAASRCAAGPDAEPGSAWLLLACPGAPAVPRVRRPRRRSTWPKSPS